LFFCQGAPPTDSQVGEQYRGQSAELKKKLPTYWVNGNFLLVAIVRFPCLAGGRARGGEALMLATHLFVLRSNGRPCAAYVAIRIRTFHPNRIYSGDKVLQSRHPKVFPSKTIHIDIEEVIQLG
jgi:hypothetical protein